jgi:hypothetical protein
VFGDQADRCFRFGLDADDAHREGTFAVADQSTGLDAARRGDHIRLS